MGQSKAETIYQAGLIKKIENILPDCFIIKLDPNQYQGIPDLLILFENKWAMLEVKADDVSPEQANQSYYVERFDDMSFAAFIHPSNEDEVLSELLERMGS